MGGALVASAGTVIVGLGMLYFSSFAKIQYTGPSIALSLTVALVAALTLAPTLLTWLRGAIFWPFKPPHHVAGADPERESLGQVQHGRLLAARRRPRGQVPHHHSLRLPGRAGSPGGDRRPDQGELQPACRPRSGPAQRDRRQRDPPLLCRRRAQPDDGPGDTPASIFDRRRARRSGRSSRRLMAIPGSPRSAPSPSRSAKRLSPMPRRPCSSASPSKRCAGGRLALRQHSSPWTRPT